MERILPYLGIVAGVLLVVLSFFVADRIEIENPSPVIATTSVSVVPALSPPALPELSVPELALATSAPKITLAPAASPKKPVQTAAAPVAAEPAPAPAPIELDLTSELSAAALNLRAALVNILCYAPAGSGLRSTSGTGVFIDPKGVILTNAHIAQHYLLAERGVSCTIRTGAPAVARYRGALMFISPGWIRENAGVLRESRPIGTGERDLAFLAVTKSATAEPLPSSFPFVPLAQTPPSAGTPVVIGSYGAQFLQANQILSALFPTLVYGSVRAVYTFGTNTIDVVDLGGSAAAQEGSSGGGMVTADGSLAGTIVTSTVEGDTATRELHAITASYIRADYASETGTPLDLLLAKSPETAASDFSAQAASLTEVLTANL